MSRVVAITGATGFVGSRVVRAALAAGWQVRAVVRSPQPSRPGVRWRRADVREPASLHGVFNGADAVLHCATAIAGAPDLLAAVNARGAEAVTAEAGRSGVERLGVLSTAAVYRDGRHAGAPEGSLVEDPASVTSRTRLEGERFVRAAGGFAVRPHLITGPGDRWAVPAGVRVVGRSGWPEGDAPPQSFVDVRDLARLLVLMIDADVDSGAVVHAAHPARTWPEVLGSLGVPVRSASPRARVEPAAREWSLLAVEHTYDSSRAQRLTGWVPEHDPAKPCPDSIAWYRGHIASSV